jgi:hypothetical protein
MTTRQWAEYQRMAEMLEKEKQRINANQPQIGQDVKTDNHKYGTTILDVDYESRQFKIKHSDYWDAQNIWVKFDDFGYDEDCYCWKKLK